MKTNRFILILIVTALFLIGSQFTMINAGYEKINSEIWQDSVYVKVDRVPVFKKYRGNVQKYLSKQIKYPVDALAKEIEGKVLVSFIITSEGELTNPKVVKGLYKSIDEEAIKAISSLSDWKPGKLNGKNVSTKVTIPVHFYISEENRLLAKQIKPLFKNDNPPLFVIDRKKVEGITTLEYYNIKSIRVIKGEKATKLYGEEGKYGVLVVETKNGTEPIYKRY